jgi:hypothetical protein
MLFITDHMTAEEAQALVDVAMPLIPSSGVIPWAKVEALTGIGYSRGWLIVRRQWLEAFQPELLVDTDALIAEAYAHFAELGKASEFNSVRDGLGKIAAHHRDSLALSWGEIAVRLGIPESRVRAAYRSLGSKKDLGLRIGKGGRWAYDASELYEDNRRKEGAMIPADLTHKPKVEELLNFDPEGRTVVAKAEAQAEKAAKAAARKSKAS